MILRMLVTGILLCAAFVAGVPHVVALWPQQPEKVAPPSLKTPPVQFFETGRLPSNTTVQDQGPVAVMANRPPRPENDAEAVLMRGLLFFQEGNVEAAITLVRQVTAEAPRFELAHLVLGDLLTSRIAPVESLGGQGLTADEARARDKRLKELRSEARARLKGYLSLLNAQHIPDVLVTLGDQVPYALVIDKSKNRLYVYRHTGSGMPPQLVDDFYIVLGRKTGDKRFEGDLKTPTGTYFVTSYLEPETLPPMYGSGAFPINYPNEYDRRQRKTGYGIWLHGTDRSLYSRPPLDTEGCVVLTNEEFVRIKQYIRIGQTPVIISEELVWLPPSQWLRHKQDIASALEQWRRSWEVADIDSYLQMYAADFWTPEHDLNSWKSYKQRVFAGKTFQQIEFSDLSVVGYPRGLDDRPVVVANFVQHYRSNNYNGDMRKRLYLVKEQEGWRVLYEGRQQ